MSKYDAIAELMLEVLKDGVQTQRSCPLGISNRHIHLSQKDLDTLFGAGYQCEKMKELSQPGQFACKETLILCGPKGAIEKVRILGPVRKQTQVEILRGDGYKLGVKAPVRMSGNLEGSAGITIIGPKGSVVLQEGVIVAQRHIHMTLEDAMRLDLCDGEIVKIDFPGSRGGTYNDVVVRANNNSSLECHIDVEEGNAMDLTSASTVNIIKLS